MKAANAKRDPRRQNLLIIHTSLRTCLRTWECSCERGAYIPLKDGALLPNQILPPGRGLHLYRPPESEVTSDSPAGAGKKGHSPSPAAALGHFTPILHRLPPRCYLHFRT